MLCFQFRSNNVYRGKFYSRIRVSAFSYRRDLFKEMKCSDGKLYVEVNRCLSSTLYEAACPHNT